MNPIDLQDKVQGTADRLMPKSKNMDRSDVELFLWNLFRERQNPSDFLLKKVAKDAFAR